MAGFARQRLLDGRYPRGEYMVCVNGLCVSPGVARVRALRTVVNAGVYSAPERLFCAGCDGELYGVVFGD